MEFAEKMCDHIAMIDKGRIILNGSLQEIKSRFGQRNVNINYSGDISFLQNHPIIEKIEDYGNTTGIRLKESGTTQELLRILIDRNISINKFDANEISLHEIFIDLAGKDEEELKAKEVFNV
jgi:ABC-2 type transport system ATP-binding protein